MGNEKPHPTPIGIFVCSRGQRREPCSVEGCGGRVVKLCDFPLVGRKSGQTCNRAMCASHAKRIGVTSDDSVDYCPVHAKMHADGIA